MSDGVHLLVPFAAGPSPAFHEAMRGLRLPRMQRLLARLGIEGSDVAGADSLSPPHERALAHACGLAAPDGLIPLAALQVQQSGQEAGTQAWAWITPSHWRVGRDHVDMAAPQELQLEDGDSRALLQAMLPYFEEDGIALTYDAPLRWLACGEIFRSLPTASLDRVTGRTLDRWMPAGDTGRPVRRLQQEMQMLLYTLPLNDARQRAGLLPVNSFWVSGTGALPGPVATPAGLQVTPALRDAVWRGDPAAWISAWEQLDAREGTRLLGELDRGRDVRVTLCGAAGARTWSSSASNAWKRVAGLFARPSPAALLEGL